MDKAQVRTLTEALATILRDAATPAMAAALGAWAAGGGTEKLLVRFRQNETLARSAAAALRQVAEALDPKAEEESAG